MMPMLMLMIAVMTPSLTFGRKKCDLRMADDLVVMKTLDLEKAEGSWILKYVFKESFFLSTLKLIEYNIYNPTNTSTDISRELIRKDGSCNLDKKRFELAEDGSGVLTTSEKATDESGNAIRESLKVLATDYTTTLMWIYVLTTGRGKTVYNLGIFVRDQTATVNWTAVDEPLRKMCTRSSRNGDWSKFFVSLSYDPDATCAYS